MKKSIKEKVLEIMALALEFNGKPTKQELTGYNPDFIDTISYILEDMKDLLENPTSENIKACRAKVDYILSAKDKAAS